MSHDSLRRKYAKKMAELRALEEQMERKNVLYGKGATPSMGLSQYRGGAGFDLDQRQIRAFGQYSDDGEMEGGMSHLHNEFRDYNSASDHFAKADKMREEKGKKGGLRTGKYEGDGKYGPFKDEAELMTYYFDKSEQIKKDEELRILLNEVDEILREAKEPEPKISSLKDRIRSHYTMKKIDSRPSAVFLSPGRDKESEPKISSLKDRIPSRYTMKKVDSRPSAVFLSPGRDKGKESVDDIIRRLPPHIRKGVEEEMKKIEEEMKKKMMKGKGKRRGSSSSSSSESEGKCEGGRGRSARAQIVKKVMAEKGLSLIEASKYVKAHGLY